VTYCDELQPCSDHYRRRLAMTHSPRTSSHTLSLTLRRIASSIPGMTNGTSNPQILRKTQFASSAESVGEKP